VRQGTPTGQVGVQGDVFADVHQCVVRLRPPHAA
jgi:hypothetical protein